MAARDKTELRLQALRQEVERLQLVRSNVERAAQLARVLDAVSAMAVAHGLTAAELDALRSAPASTSPRGLREQLKQRATEAVSQVWTQGPFSGISELAFGAASALDRSASALLSSAAPTLGEVVPASKAPIALRPGAVPAEVPSHVASESRGAAVRASRPASPESAAKPAPRAGAVPPAAAERSTRSPSFWATSRVAAPRASRAAAAAPVLRRVASGAVASARARFPWARRAAPSGSPVVLSVGAGRAAGRAGMQLIAASLLHLPRLHRQLHAVRRGADFAMQGAGFAMQGAGFAMQGAGIVLQHTKLPRLPSEAPVEPQSVSGRVRASLPSRPARATATSILVWSGRSGLQLTYEIASAGAQMLLRRYVLPRVLRYLSSSMTRREIAPARPLRPLRSAR